MANNESILDNMSKKDKEKAVAALSNALNKMMSDPLGGDFLFGGGMTEERANILLGNADNTNPEYGLVKERPICIADQEAVEKYLDSLLSDCNIRFTWTYDGWTNFKEIYGIEDVTVAKYSLSFENGKIVKVFFTICGKNLLPSSGLLSEYLDMKMDSAIDTSVDALSCSKCGKAMNPRAAYCRYCGRKLENVHQSTVARIRTCIHSIFNAKAHKMEEHDKVNLIREYRMLMLEGAISEEEFSKKKSEILND